MSRFGQAFGRNRQRAGRPLKIILARYLSLLSYLGLIAYAMGWAIQLSGTPTERISLALLLYVTPLLITLRGVLHGKGRGLIWSSLVSLLYMLHGGVVWWTEPYLQHWGLLEMSLALMHLLSSSFYIRWRADAASDQAGAPST